MQLYVSLKINLDIPFPNTIKACKIFQPIFPVAYSYIKDSVVVVSQNKNKSKTNKNKSKTNKKTLQVYAIKCIDRKTGVRRGYLEREMVGHLRLKIDPYKCLTQRDCRGAGRWRDSPKANHGAYLDDVSNHYEMQIK